MPENLGAPVNSDLNEFYPSLTYDGKLYFTGLFDQEATGENIYVATPNGMGYSEPVKVMIEQGAYGLDKNEFNAFVAPDESYLIYSSDKKGVRGDFADLYISFQQDGRWSDAKNLGEQINTSNLDYCPFVFEQDDKRTLYFTKTEFSIRRVYPEGLDTESFIKNLNHLENGNGNIYKVDFDALLEAID